MDILNGFKEIDGFPNYFVNKQGDIISKKVSFYMMKPYVGNNGYKFIKLIDKDGKTRHQSIHRLVAKAFIPNPENKATVNHIDGDRGNNNVENLEWLTLKENHQHSFENLGQSPIRNFVECSLYQDGKFIKSFKSIAEASRYAGKNLGVSATMVEKWHKNKNVNLVVNK